MSVMSGTAVRGRVASRFSLRGWALAGIVAVAGGVGGIAFFDTGAVDCDAGRAVAALRGLRQGLGSSPG